MQLQFKRLSDSARLPVYATEGAAAFDLHADTESHICVYPGEAEVICIGLQVEVPAGHVLQLFSRSGHAFKHGIRLSNCVGIIDSDFRGELMVKVHNDSEDLYRIEAGERIAQGIITPIPRCTFVEVAELSSTDRGALGFGSTGVQPELFEPDYEIARRLANDVDTSVKPA
uniref:dUTP diphosphatase n=1 Tax=Pseudomonas phage Pavpe01 TaxID=3138545 RepID=A0AAU6W198_9VIRU